MVYEATIVKALAGRDERHAARGECRGLSAAPRVGRESCRMRTIRFAVHVTGALLPLVLWLVGSGTAGAADRALTIATWGGAYEHSQKKAYFEPFTAKHGNPHPD